MQALTASESEPWNVPLQPSPAALEGFEVVADNLATTERRLRQRRTAAPVAVRTVDQERLLASTASDLLEVLTTEASVRRSPARGPPL